MSWLAVIPYLFLIGCAFLLGLMVGSFLNVLIARLPYEKSIIWPGSRCFVCYRPIRILDNIPILGYLRLKGRCRACGASFSARYLWVEIGTGVAFAAILIVEVLLNATGGPWDVQPWLHTPGLQFPFHTPNNGLLNGIVYWAAHSFLLAALIASAVIDAKHRIIPPQITYVGTLVGLIVSVCFPWPWPNTNPADIANLPVNAPWVFTEARIPNGLCLWPFWGPWPAWAPPGTWQMGLMNGLIGAGVGMLIARAVRGLFGFGFGRESMGLGDADLLMMAGAFLGWQAIALALPAGAVITLVALPFVFVWKKLRGHRFDPGEMAFGPGIAAGVVMCWFGWPWLERLVQAAFFDLTMIGVVGGVFGGGLLIAGFLLRRRSEPAPEPVKVG
jgi:leader peptidase (prepilin peptidase) / N-methyltransferase